MPRFLTFLVALAVPVLSGPTLADETLADQTLTIVDSAQAQLEDYRWIARPLVIFADAEADPRFAEQMELLLAVPEALLERDVVVITDTNPKARSAIRTDLRPRGFMLTLLAKDGSVVFRKPLPWDVREISRAIDKLPLRKQELSKARAVDN